MSTHRTPLRKSLSLAGAALFVGLALQPAVVRAAEVQPRDFQALGGDFRIQQAEPRHPNGAEILSGFSSADSEAHSQAGETRHR
jgi:hypothetical protein